MRYWLFKDKAWAYAFQTFSYSVFGAGSYVWYRTHGIALYAVALAVLGIVLLAQRGFRQMTNFGLPVWAERCGLAFSFGAALLFDALVPSIDAQANAFVAALLVLCGIFLLMVAGGSAAIVVALIRRKIS